MDNLTHSLVGATLAELALPAGAPRATRRSFFIAGVVAANLPDADLVYTRITPAPLGALLHHRGHTHTVAGIALLGLAMAAIWMLPSLREAVGPLRRRFWAMLAIALASHLVLDSWNSYGVHPFWPLSERWYYGDAVFIMEPWLWLLLGTAATLNTVSRWGHALLGGTLALLAGGAVLVRMLPFGGLAAPAVCAIVLGVVMRHWTPRRRAATALALALTFVAASFVTREVVRAKVLGSATSAVRPQVVDLVLSPRGGNPLCWTVVSVVRDEAAGRYQLTRGDVAVYAPSACGPARESAVRWDDPTTHSLAQLRALYRDDCWVRGWMQFGRAPVIEDGAIADLRYGNSFRGNFTTMMLLPPAEAAHCPANLTPWRPPRSDLLSAEMVATGGTPVRTAVVDTLTHPAWSRRAVIYEVNVRQFTPEGTLSAIRPHLSRLKALGVDIIWLMPVQPIGRKNRKGVMGSYYSISDYTAINPELGTMADFDALVAAAHSEGLKVLLDWVPNHTAFDHPWITQHRDWYVTRADGTIINARDNEGHDTDWTDVAELNYGNAELRRAMIDAMRWWLEQGHVDGFRCDVAGGVPLDFWMRARAELLRVRPDLFMLAEAEDPRLHAAFDMTYGWELHHLLNDVAQGKRPAPSLDAYFARQDSLYGRGAYRLYFTSNHDENSWNGSEFERMGANAMPAFVLAATVRGSMPLLYTGQEVSLRKRLRFFEKDTVDWRGASLAPFYHAMFDLKHRHQALANGAEGGDQTTLRTNAGERVYVFVRSRGDDVVVVALNFGDAPVAAAYRDLRTPGTFTDWFSRAAIALPAAGTIEIPAHGYRVLVR